ncbi:MAG: arylsulfatase [Acidimicrobiales bacterium]|nr:arylsulfatase [Acidimicrobiales bacterium]
MTGPEPFGGVIGRTLAESTPHFPERPHPGDDAPNVVLILLDDTGFAQLGCYGSEMATPNIDRLAADGLRYTNFHVTPLCSPTRASLLTGRDHHTVGMRGLSNFNTGFPHMRGHVSNHAATVAEVLRDEGYATFCVGKWHLCPMEDASVAGPFDQWPLGRGFERFYGFMEGETDQFHPQLVHDNHPVDPPATPDEGYHLTEDLVDRSLRFVNESVSIRPDRPFFLYLALGAMHAPHQAPAEYLERWRGRFDDGWDVARERWFARQVEMGIVPPGTELAPRNPGVDPWDSLDEDARRLAARLQEAFAAFLEHTDDQLGRLFAGLDRLGLRDDTVVIFLSDNGASQEGGPFGVLHEMKFFNGILETPAEAVAHVDEIGGPHSHANYPWGWAQAGNTPFKWYKQNTHEGGVHVPLIVRDPRRITDGGGLRDQFHHVTDIVPTIYDLAGVTPPAVRLGREQIPIAGVPFTYTFGAADAPSTRTVQYFEMVGHRALYEDGWKVVTRHEGGTPFDDDVWELYHVAADRSECHDLAAEQPDRVEAMVARWWEEAEAKGVLPLDDRLIELFGSRFRDRSVHPADRRYVYRPPLSPLPQQVGPAIGGRSWDLRATVDRPPGAGGVLFAVGTGNSGLTVHVMEDHLVFDYNCFGDHHVARSSGPVPTGATVLGVDFRRDGRGGTATLVVDGEPDATIEIPRVMGVISSIGPSVGFDHGSPVSDAYRSPNAFAGTIDSVEVQLVGRGGLGATEAAERMGMGTQ